MERVRAHLESLRPANLLDVGGGTGLYAAAVPSEARYVVVDTDLAKLERLKKRVPTAIAVLADATDLPVKDGSVDVALFIAVAHHLPDDLLERALRELARVARRVVFLDPLASGRLPARALWRLDRGSRPRSAEELIAAARQHFDLDRVERYSILHDYLLWIGRAQSAPLR